MPFNRLCDASKMYTATRNSTRKLNISNIFNGLVHLNIENILTMIAYFISITSVEEAISEM